MEIRRRRNVFDLALIEFSAPAMAYVDPGSGSIVMSAIIGFFVAVGMAAKTFWYKIKSFGSTGSSVDLQHID